MKKEDQLHPLLECPKGGSLIDLTPKYIADPPSEAVLEWVRDMMERENAAQTTGR